MFVGRETLVAARDSLHKDEWSLLAGLWDLRAGTLRLVGSAVSGFNEGGSVLPVALCSLHYLLS